MVERTNPTSMASLEKPSVKFRKTIGTMLMLFSMAASAQFADNGFKSQTPSVRTDFANNLIGTSASPLVVKPCIFTSSTDPKM